MSLHTFSQLKSIFFGFILIASFSACKGLQYRETTEEIKQRHLQLKVPTTLSRYEATNIKRAIRVQEVTLSENDVNILFLHGSPSSLTAWRGYMIDPTLVEKANLYAVDRPGYGYSGFGEALTSIKTQAQVLSSFIEAYKLKNVIVVGASYGGPLAARIAVINPNVKAVIMISPAIDPEQEKKIWASRLTQWWLTRWLVPTGYRVAGDEKTTHAEELKKIEADWVRLTTPVIHIHGNEDDVVPYGNVNFSKKVFSNIKTITIPNAGHEIAWKRSELVKPEIVDIISQLLKQLH